MGYHRACGARVVGITADFHRQIVASFEDGQSVSLIFYVNANVNITN